MHLDIENQMQDFLCFYKKGLEINLVCSYGKSLRYIQLDEKNVTYLFIYISNDYHNLNMDYRINS